MLEGYASGRRDFNGVVLKGARLTGLELRGIDLSAASLSGADLSGADLSGADLSGADLSGSRLVGAVFRRADLSGADLSGADLSDSNFYQADLRQVDLSQANLTRASISNARLDGTDLSEAILHRAYMAGSVLQGACLAAADLAGADLSGANLTGADLTEADLEAASIVESELDGADLDEADLTHTNVGTDGDLLCASWKSIKIGSITYSRALVERGEQVLPIGMGAPLRFIFGVDRALDGDDLLAVRQLLKAIDSASSTSVRFEVTKDRNLLVVDGRGPSTDAGVVGVLMAQFKELLSAESKVVLDGLGQLVDEQREEHSQLLTMAARQSLEFEKLQRLITDLRLEEIEFQTNEEAERFGEIVKGGSLVSSVGRRFRFAKGFILTSEMFTLLGELVALGLLSGPAAAVAGLKAGVAAGKAVVAGSAKVGALRGQARKQREILDPE